jgi:hypothetical protein
LNQKGVGLLLAQLDTNRLHDVRHRRSTLQTQQEGQADYY